MSCHGMRVRSAVGTVVPGRGKPALIPGGFSRRRSAPGRHDMSLCARAGNNPGEVHNRNHSRRVCGIVATNIGCTAKRVLPVGRDNASGAVGPEIAVERAVPRSVRSPGCMGDGREHLIVSWRALVVETLSGRASISRTFAASGEPIGPGRSHYDRIVAGGGESGPVAGSVPHMELHLPDMPIAPRRRHRTTARRADQRRSVSDLSRGSPAPAGRARPNPTPARRPVPTASVPGRRPSRWCLARRSIR